MLLIDSHVFRLNNLIAWCDALYKRNGCGQILGLNNELIYGCGHRNGCGYIKLTYHANRLADWCNTHAFISGNVANPCTGFINRGSHFLSSPLELINIINQLI